PTVQYGYSLSSDGGSRLTSMAVAGADAVTYGYDGLDGSVGRVSYVAQGSTHLEDYKYLGLATIVGRETGVAVNRVMLDESGWIVGSDWAVGDEPGDALLHSFRYGYDADGNVRARLNQKKHAFDDVRIHDRLNH